MHTILVRARVGDSKKQVGCVSGEYHSAQQVNDVPPLALERVISGRVGLT